MLRILPGNMSDHFNLLLRLACIPIATLCGNTYAQQVKSIRKMPARYEAAMTSEYPAAYDSVYRYMPARDASAALFRRNVEQRRNNTSLTSPPGNTEYYYLKQPNVFYVED